MNIHNFYMFRTCKSLGWLMSYALLMKAPIHRPSFSLQEKSHLFSFSFNRKVPFTEFTLLYLINQLFSYLPLKEIPSMGKPLVSR